MRFARWKFYILCFALGLALAANVAQLLLAAQVRRGVQREMDARAGLAYVHALHGAQLIASQPELEPDAAVARLTTLRARLEGALDALAGLDQGAAMNAPVHQAVWVLIEDAAGRSANRAELETAVNALKTELLARVEALSLPDLEKARINEAYRPG